MIRIGAFLGSLAACGLLLFLVRGIPQNVDAFHPDQTLRRKVLSMLPATDAVEVKLAHARLAENPEIGLFGNSRALMVDGASLGQPGSFYNYAITGISFATSVDMIERLDAMGKLPAIVLVSFDNPLISHPPYPALDPNPLRRWQRYAGDLIWALHDPETDWRTIRANLVEQLLAEWQRVRGIFSFEQQRLVMAYRLPGRIPVIDVPAYRVDGSRPEQLPDRHEAVEVTFRQIPYLMALTLDMKRLADVAARNKVHLVIYTSPLYPPIAAQAKPGPDVVRLASQFEAACRQFRLDCRSAPDLGDPFRPPYWPDGSHAPAALLGTYLGKLVRDGETISVGAK